MSRDVLAPEHRDLLEDKRYSVAVHYRQSPDSAAAGRAILSAAVALPESRLIPGKRVFNIVRWTVMPRGGHFAPAEEPELLARDITAFFTPLRV